MNLPTPRMQRKLGAQCWHLTLDGYNTLCRQRVDAWTHSTTREPLDLSLRLCRRCRARWAARGTGKPACARCGSAVVYRGLFSDRAYCNHCGEPTPQP